MTHLRTADAQPAWIKVHIFATGQRLEMLPDVARAMIAGGTAAAIDAEPVERTTVAAKLGKRVRRLLRG